MTRTPYPEERAADLICSKFKYTSALTMPKRAGLLRHPYVMEFAMPAGADTTDHMRQLTDIVNHWGDACADLGLTGKCLLTFAYYAVFCLIYTSSLTPAEMDAVYTALETAVQSYDACQRLLSRSE